MSEQTAPTEFSAGDAPPDPVTTHMPDAMPSSPGVELGTCGFAMHATSMPWEDLSADMLIRGAARTPFQGATAPVLGGVALLARLGQGGMGKVYFGFHLRLEREVAVKVVWTDMAERHPELIPRFKREARLASKIVSPHLVTVLDVDEKDGLHYMVMEYVHGFSAAGYLKELKAAQCAGLPETEALEVCLAAAKGLAAAHQKGIIHRDVKPDNILIPRNDAAGGLQFEGTKLADLGIARQETSADSHLTLPRQFMGTPGFAAPEQCGGADTCGKPADIFAMGATLYAMLAGREPFAAMAHSSGDPFSQVVNAVKNTPHAPIRSLRADVTPGTAYVIDRCLEKKPEHRYQDAKELVTALERALEKVYGERNVQGRSESARKMTEPVGAPTAFVMAPKAEDFEERALIDVREEPRLSEASQEAEAWRSKSRGARKTGGWLVPAICVLTMVLGAAGYTAYSSRGYIAELFNKNGGAESGKPEPRNRDREGAAKTPPAQPPNNKIDEQPAKSPEPVKQEPAKPPETKVEAPGNPPNVKTSLPPPEKKIDEPPVKPPEKKIDETPAPPQKKPDEIPVKPVEKKIDEPAVRNPPLLSLDLGKNVKLELVRIAAGSFKMGSPVGEEARDDAEIQHEVTIGKAFYLAKYPVTQAQYETVMGENPSEFKGPELPVENVSWFDAVKFCEKVKGLTEKSVRLPTEAQWEYACRAGTTTPFYTGETISTDDANYDGEFKYDGGKTGEYRRRTTPVGSFKPNAFGLYDMHGNVWQWCQDFHSEIYYRNSEPADPSGPVTGTDRVSRGGSWNLPPRNARSASRNHNQPGFRAVNLGFRVAVGEE